MTRLLSKANPLDMIHPLSDTPTQYDIPSQHDDIQCACPAAFSESLNMMHPLMIHPLTMTHPLNTVRAPSSI